MFKRFLLLLLIAILPLQGIAASFAVKCAGMSAAGQTLQSAQAPADDMSAMSGDMPCHGHSDEGALANIQPDQGCCHHMTLAIPPAFVVPDAPGVPAQLYPVIDVSFSDHLPDRLQRPPLALAT